VDFPRASWTSFDRYDRYGAIARAIRANLGPGRHRVLDVGDSSGYLQAFDADLHVVSADIVASAAPLPGLVLTIADGSRLPFRSRSFDAVVSSDALEHVPPDERALFVVELTRAARELVVLAAPFDTPGVAGAEELVRRYCLLAAGQPQEQLDEHAAHGLPMLDTTCATIEAEGLTVVNTGNGNLFDWLLMMLVKQQLSARPALAPLEQGYDILYNFVLSGRAQRAPFYRHVVVGSRHGVPALGEEIEPLPGTPADIAPLLAAIMAADVSEATRQDVVPELHRMQHDIAAQLDALATRVEQLHQRIDGLTRPRRRVRDAIRRR